MRLTRPLAEGSERVQLRLIDTAFNEALVDLDLVTAAIDGPSGGSVSRKVKMVFGNGGVGSLVGTLTDHLSSAEAQSSLFKLPQNNEVTKYPCLGQPHLRHYYFVVSGVGFPILRGPNNRWSSKPCPLYLSCPRNLAGC